MANRSFTSLAVVVFIAGILNAGAILGGFYLLNSTVQQKPFASPSSTTVSQDNVVPLSDGRFAIVSEYQISVYRVDERNRITRLNEVTTLEQTLKPIKRPNYPSR